MDRPYRRIGHRPNPKTGEWETYELAPAHVGQVCQVCYEQDHGRTARIWRDGKPVNKPFSPTGWP